MEDSFAVSFFALKMEKTPGFWLSLIRKLFNKKRTPGNSFIGRSEQINRKRPDKKTGQEKEEKAWNRILHMRRRNRCW